jgi:hypothetical protein
MKWINLEKNKTELEDVIFRQEHKVKKLSSSVKNILNIVKLKNIEIDNNKKYITSLQNTIKELKKEIYMIRLNKIEENSKDILNLKMQIKDKNENRNNIIINKEKNIYKFLSRKNNNISRNYQRNIFSYLENKRNENKITTKNMTNNITPLNISKIGKSYHYKERNYDSFVGKINGSNQQSRCDAYSENRNNKTRIVKVAQILNYKHFRNGSNLKLLKNKNRNTSIKNFMSLNDNLKKIYKIKDDKKLINSSEEKDLINNNSNINNNKFSFDQNIYRKFKKYNNNDATNKSFF